MRAVIVNAAGAGFAVEDIDLADPMPNEIVVEVRASGLCHSDLSIAEQGMGFPMPALLGHEVAGEVVEVGASVTSTKVGDRVVICMVAGCGACRECRAARPYRCQRTANLERNPSQMPRISRNGEALTQFMGVGGFAERILVHENLAIPLSDAVPYDVACLLGCGVVTGAGAAINTAGIRPGDTVAVLGCGGVGLNTIQGAALAGASRIIAVDLQPAKLDLAKKFGATDVVNAGDGDAVEAVRELTGGGVDFAFEVIGMQPTAEQAVRMLAVGGSALLIGVQKPGNRLDLDLFGEIVLPQRRIIGVAMGSTNPHLDIPMFAELYLQGRFNLDDLVSDRITLGEIDRSYQLLAGGAVARAVVTKF
ncbi:zinc-binding dehydrogenase [Arthrobacter crystallopoietes]|uniref:S-(Hydroxymethyl)glutathione dehydrogenase / alcohol dehydrogenase n=1 Tax=Crystallibacter crystallopoietes TaxID=37928 RepID=A0A1H1BXM8_9MICC|nr:Zn-dependent alcohol dehydrogenase [Arthrobacter crystallopoietes]AUI50970.1 alcohol dehydrogenase [Arthrobacter crystallopoietes]SDQ56669.1 S-(hydroxymethyl)glutathione dehydrogenase / alcohol dehydrogenase [Arthrobacter crystallopoietes]